MGLFLGGLRGCVRFHRADSTPTKRETSLLKTEASALSYALDSAGVVIDGMTDIGFAEPSVVLEDNPFSTRPRSPQPPYNRGETSLNLARSG